MANQQTKKPAIFNQFKLGTVNVSTAREEQRLQQIADQVAQYGLLACAVQETKRIGNGSAMLKARDADGIEQNFHFYWSGATIHVGEGPPPLHPPMVIEGGNPEKSGYRRQKWAFSFKF